MIINRSGLTIRVAISSIRVSGRATQGVKLINIKGKDAIAAVAKVELDGSEELEVNENDLNENISEENNNNETND